MPILLPTPDELARMGKRERDALAKRMKLERPMARKSLNILTFGSLFGESVREEARALEAITPVDPDAEAHVKALLEALR